MTRAEVFGQMCALAARSPQHAHWRIDNASRLFLPPIELGQFLIIRDGSAFVTWAWLSKEAAEGYVSRTRKLQPLDWNSGPDLWFIDLIAPFGNVRALIRGVRNLFPKQTFAQASRRYGNDHPGRIGSFINA